MIRMGLYPRTAYISLNAPCRDARVPGFFKDDECVHNYIADTDQFVFSLGHGYARIRLSRGWAIIPL